MSSLNHILNRNGTYYFRAVVPKDLLIFFEKREIKKSLKTKSFQIAKKQASLLSYKKEYIFEIIRDMSKYSTEKAKEVANDFMDEAVHLHIQDFQRLMHENGRAYAIETFETMLSDYIINSRTNKSLYLEELGLYYAIRDHDGRDLPFDTNTLSKSESDEYSNIIDVAAIEAVRKALEISTGQCRDIRKPLETHNALEHNYNVQEIVSKFKEHLEYRVKQGSLKERSKDAQLEAVSLLNELFSDKPLEGILKENARFLRDLLKKVPQNYTKRHQCNGLTLQEVSEKKYGENIPLLSPKTINLKINFIKGFFEWAINEGYYNAPNPFLKLALPLPKRAEDERNPFTKQQVKQFANYLTEKEKGSPLYWIVLLGLYTGARLNELHQLTSQDIKEENGIHYISINVENGKEVKTAAGIRVIPLHPQLIKIGFLDYVKECDRHKKTLFYNYKKAVKPSPDALSKRFSRILSTLNLKKKELTFHSLRHTFIDALRRAEVSESVSKRLSGHSDSKDVHARYGSTNDLEILSKAINKIDYDEGV